MAEPDRLDSLKIDRSQRRNGGGGWAKWWIVIGILLLVGFGAWRMLLSPGARAAEVEIMRVQAASSGGAGDNVVLNAAGYIVAHHKIEVASKVSGKVAWIGVEKGDQVEKDQVVVRLEDDEFQARVRQAEGNLAALDARLAELNAGSRPEEVELALANLNEAKARLEDARLDYQRAKELAEAGVLAAADFDQAQARHQAQTAAVQSLDRAYELMRIGPRKEEIDSVRGQVAQAQGQLEYDRTLLKATLIRAPVSGTILERNVEIGEFVTTSFVGERGAKGYVVSLADLDDIQVELDISQDDFSRLRMGSKGTVTTDAYPDREYNGEIVEISPEANRQKATVQVKVQILEPDSYLRPEMNANVAFLADERGTATQAQALIEIPSSAIRDGKVFLHLDGKAVERIVETGRTTTRGIEIRSGLSGGEDLIVSPPTDLTDGASIRPRA